MVSDDQPVSVGNLKAVTDSLSTAIAKGGGSS